MSLRRDDVIQEASGDGLCMRGVRGVVPGVVVERDEDGSNVRAGLVQNTMRRAERSVVHTSCSMLFGQYSTFVSSRRCRAMARGCGT